MTDLLFPVRCQICGKILLNENPRSLPDSDLDCPEQELNCCYDCFDYLLPATSPCPQCGGTLYIPYFNKKGCRSCKKWRHTYTAVTAFCEYSQPLQKLIRQIKYDRQGEAARFWAHLLFHTRKNVLTDFRPELIIPVPMHYLRKFNRKFNPPDILADELGRLMKLPVRNDLIYQCKLTKRQAYLDPQRRLSNPKDSFDFFPKKTVQAKVNPLQNRTVLLVDDILTTGTTCEEAAKTLRRAGAGKIYVAVIARGQGGK